jgi:glycosyltransferase involved in cell wall biosynthesis
MTFKAKESTSSGTDFAGRFSRLLKRKKPKLSFIVVLYNMQREGERTLQSLSKTYQYSTELMDYEVIVIDNGSNPPFNFKASNNCDIPVKFFYINDADPSPAAAINFGVSQCSGDYVAIMIDGARMLTPGVVSKAATAITLANQPLISVLGLHIGPEHQRMSVKKGYSKAVEDELLNQIDWWNNGYRLFEISSWGGSSPFGWFGQCAESNCLILTKKFFSQLNGYDETFTMPGGGLVNLDFYKRAVESTNASLIYLLGEASFHQLHGGVTTDNEDIGLSFEQLNVEYQRIRGKPYTAPTATPYLFGSVAEAAAPAMQQAVDRIMSQRKFSTAHQRYAEAVIVARD